VAETTKKKRHPYSAPIPTERKKEICPVCRDDFSAHEYAVVCPNTGCRFLYHDWGEGETCWDAIERCARPGCNGKEIERARNKKQIDKQNIRYFARKINKGEQLTESEMLLFAQLLRDYPDVELSPKILQKVKFALKRK
jgi:hypothetical protein